MSGSTQYNVVLALSTTGSFASSLDGIGSKASSAEGKIAGLKESASGVGEAIASMGEKVGGFLEHIADKAIETAASFAKIAIGATVGAAAYGVAGLNRELEETQISLGAIAQVQGFAKTFEGGFKMAGDQLTKMKQDIKTLPGDLGQLSGIMNLVATPAAQGGASLDQIRVLSGKTMLVAGILGVQQDMAAREMGQLLAGRSGAHNILGSKLGIVGEASKKFNAESPAERLKEVETYLGKYDGAAKRFGESWIAQLTTLKDNFKYTFLAPATLPLFTLVKHAIGEVNTYFDDHKHKIEEVANTIGSRLAGAWTAIEETFKRIEPWVAKIADHILHMQPGDILHKLEGAAKTVLLTKAVGTGLSLGAQAIPMLMKYGGAGGGGPGMLAGLAEAAPAVGTALLGLSAVAVPLAGIFDNLTNDLNQYHEADLKLVEQLGVKSAELARMAAPAMGTAHKLVDDYGHEFLVELDKTAGYLITFGHAIGTAVEGLSALAFVIKNGGLWNGGREAYIAQKVFDLSVDKAGPVEDHTAGLDLNLMKRFAPNEKFGPEKDDPSMKPKEAPTTNIHVNHLEIRVEGNDDPSRVARLTATTIQDWARSPTSSRFVPNYTSPR